MNRLIAILALATAAVCLLADAEGQSKQPTSAELSRAETPGKAVMRTFEFQEYDVRSAAEAMPEDKWDFRPAAGMFKNEKPEFGPAEVRTFREQVKHVACANFAFAAELDGATPPAGCDKEGPARRTAEPSCSAISATPSPCSGGRSMPSRSRTCTIPCTAPTPHPIRGWASPSLLYGTMPITLVRWRSTCA